MMDMRRIYAILQSFDTSDLSKLDKFIKEYDIPKQIPQSGEFINYLKDNKKIYNKIKNKLPSNIVGDLMKGSKLSMYEVSVNNNINIIGVYKEINNARSEVIYMLFEEYLNKEEIYNVGSKCNKKSNF